MGETNVWFMADEVRREGSRDCKISEVNTENKSTF